MLVTEWAASKLVAILPAAPNASQWRLSNETGMNVKVAGDSCMPTQTSRKRMSMSKVQPVIPFLYHAPGQMTRPAIIKTKSS